MLEGLDQIDWSKLGHAYGEATDVPGLLRELASHDKEEREHAFSGLCGSILHQGTVYEATAFAVPFLIELLKSADVLEKNEILILLAQIARGTSYHDVHQHLRMNREKAKAEEWQDKIRQELVLVEKATAAVQNGEPLYLDLLSHPDSSVREASAYLLARLPRPSAVAGERIWDRFLTESAVPVKVSLVLSFGFGTIAANTKINRLAELFASASDKSIALAAAMSLVKLAPDAASQNLIGFLVSALGRRDQFPAFSKTAWVIMDDFEPSVMGCLETLTGDAAAIVEKELEMGLAGREPGQTLACILALLTLAFRTGIARGTALTALTERQKRIVKILADHPEIWDQRIGGMTMPNVQTASMMRSCGLPDNGVDFMEFASGKVKASSPTPRPKKKAGFVDQIKTFFGI